MPNTVNQDIPHDSVSAAPTKRFFMEMLTRDIELSDAILDLIDNCIDGVHRETKRNLKDGKSPYAGFFCEINISADEFSIKDNCGGIPFHVAKSYAFKLGRDNQGTVDNNLPTVGMYGIGMKRAIFKMGNVSEVTSWNNDDMFKVVIPANWVSTEGWYFHYSMLGKKDVLNNLSQPGTVLRVTELHDNISSQFSDKINFVKNLSIIIKQHYGYIIQQGFRISLNGEEVQQLELNILTDNGSELSPLKPFVYTNKLGNVNVDIVVGFYRPLPTDDEIEEELEGHFAPSVTQNAGITVICNDRIVLYCDKSYITGWGDTPIPKYHTQFIAITGVVHFRSSTPLDLPVTTTKRGLNTSATIYLQVKERIKEGLKIYTGFTNNWKKKSAERDRIFKNTTSINVLEPDFAKNKLIELNPQKGDADNDALYQIPKLPKPPRLLKTEVSITFKKDRAQVEELGTYYFGSKKKTPSEIGLWCFDQMYSQVE